MVVGFLFACLYFLYFFFFVVVVVVIYLFIFSATAFIWNRAGAE